jgi:methionyl-tRNA synthetase
MNELQVNIRCPYCKQSLMDEGKTIDGYPSAKVFIQNSNKRGLLYLSSIYGSYNIISEVYVPMDEIVLFFCPHCQSSLLLKNLCDKCGAPMTFFELLQGGKVQICSRRGCKKHLIAFSNLSQEISTLYNTYEVFADPSRADPSGKK